MFFLASELGVTIGVIEAMPAREFFEWAAWYNLRGDGGRKPEMSDDEMIAKAKQITAGMKARRSRG